MIQLGIIYNTESVKNPSIANAGQAWAEIEHNNVYKDPVYVNLSKEKLGAVNNLIKQAKITALPTILFVEVTQEQKKIITRLSGTHSLGKIKSVYLDVLNGKFSGEGTSSDQEGENTILPQGNGDGGFGIGLFDIGFSLPKWGWGVLAAFGTYKALDAETTVGQIGFTGASAYAWGQTFKK